MKYTYKVAEEKDEQELRSFIASMPMPGSISIRLERNPNFFAAAAVEGEVNETIVIREQGGSVSGLGIRSEKQAYVNGAQKTVGYLSGLRIAEEHRSLRHLSHAYSAMQKQHEKGRAQLYISTIVEENERAAKVLESGRGSLPRYNYFGQYLTYVIPPGRVHGSPEFDIRLAEKIDMTSLIEFLNENGASKQFFPVYKADDFTNGLLKGLDKVFLAFKNGEICGTMGLWDQHRYKQVYIDSYSTSMKLIRPFYNLQAKLRRRASLPGAGKLFNNFKVAIPLVKDDDIQVFYSLLEMVSYEAAKCKKPLIYGVHENDPFKETLEEISSRVYKSRIYVVHWPDGKEEFEGLDRDLVPYLELGGL